MSQFVDVPGLEYLFAVSRDGRVLRKARETPGGSLEAVELKVRRLNAGAGKKLYGVRVTLNGKRKEYSLRALLRRAFGEEPKAPKAARPVPEHPDRVMPRGEGRSVAGYPGYTVFENGAVCGPYGRPLIQKRVGRYLAVVVRGVDRKAHEHMAHKLVLETFVGPRPPGAVACHGHRGGHDNSVGNLRWDTPEANHRDRVLANRLRAVGLY